MSSSRVAGVQQPIATEQALDDVDRNVEARLAVEALLADVVPAGGARA